MHIDIVPNRNSKPAVLLRESYRERDKVKKRTLANLSALPMNQVEMIRRVLKGEKLGPTEELFEIVRSQHHGAVQAVRTAMHGLGFDKLISPHGCRERDVVVAMVAGRLIAPEASKLAMTHAWRDSTLADELGVADADEDELYEAMDWLIVQQDAIEQRLGKRHLAEGGLVLFDLTSTSFEGTACPLAALGYNRDGEPGMLQINWGLLTDSRGCPIAVSVFEGNTADPTTLLPQVEKVREQFSIATLVMVGDRGMISETQINALKQSEGVHWITALRNGAIVKLADGGQLQLGLFDERNLFTLTHPDFPDERLVVCRNGELAKQRTAKRQDLIAATERQLEKVKSMVENGRLKGRAAIGVRVGKVVNKYKVAKHFDLDINDEGFSYSVNSERVAGEAALDGIYVVRTSVPARKMSSEEVVLNYKSLSAVERAFRSMKGVDLHVRPIRHHLEDRVRAHIFLSMLAYYVQWHMIEAWRPLLFADEQSADKQARDPVAPAKRSKRALAKVHNKRLEDGTPAMSFRTLFDHMATIVKNTCRPKGARQGEATFELTTRPNAKQQQALDLLAAITL
jgi:transposase